MRKRKLTKANASKVFDLLSEAWPQAHCELEFSSPFQLVLAVLLSAQATDKSVNKALTPLYKKYPNFDAPDLVKMGEKKFFQWIKTIGLASTKAKNAVGMARRICEIYGGEVPRKQEDLESLPGVGRKTANVVRNVLHGEPTMPVDTHVGRVAQRVGLVEATTNLRVIEEQLLACVPQKHAIQAHHYLIFQGRYVCTARSPRCENCAISSLCQKNIEQ
jgi:endonuclease-3